MTTFVSLDFETTGSRKSNRNMPWQLGLAQWDTESGEIILTKNWYLQIPKDHVFNPYTPGRWAELRDVLTQSPTIQEIWHELSPIILNSILVAHNAPTERTILRQEFPLHSFGPWIDTLQLFKKAYPKLPSHTLGDLLDTFSLTPQMNSLFPGMTPHDALYDAIGCGMLLQLLRSFPDWTHIDRLISI